MSAREEEGGEEALGGAWAAGSVVTLTIAAAAAGGVRAAVAVSGACTLATGVAALWQASESGVSTSAARTAKTGVGAVGAAVGAAMQLCIEAGAVVRLMSATGVEMASVASVIMSSRAGVARESQGRSVACGQDARDVNSEVQAVVDDLLDSLSGQSAC